MSDSSFLRKKFLLILHGFFFLVIFFFTPSCTSKKQPLLSTCLTAEEKADLEYFLRSLIFENHGAFVLFGSKPICEMSLRDLDAEEENEAAFQRWFDTLPEDKQASLKATMERLSKKSEPIIEFERNPYQGWLAWEKARKTFNMNRCILRVTPVPVPGSDLEVIPGSYRVLLVNIQQTALVLAENYAIFRNASGMEFHPLEIVFELQNPDSVFWKNVFSPPHHLAKGLLFGFGLKNSLFGDWDITCANAPSSEQKTIVDYFRTISFPLSAVPVTLGQGSLSNFTIPLFRAVTGDDTIKKYLKEKKMIEKIYRGKDLVETTLQHFAS